MTFKRSAKVDLVAGNLQIFDGAAEAICSVAILSSSSALDTIVGTCITSAILVVLQCIRKLIIY